MQCVPKLSVRDFKVKLLEWNAPCFISFINMDYSGHGEVCTPHLLAF